MTHQMTILDTSLMHYTQNIGLERPKSSKNEFSFVERRRHMRPQQRSQRPLGPGIISRIWISLGSLSHLHLTEQPNGSSGSEATKETGGNYDGKKLTHA